MNKEIWKILEKRERKKIFSQFQAVLEEEGKIPAMPPLLLRKMERIFQFAGGMFLGFFLGLFSLLAIFIVFVKLIHFEF